MSKYQFYKLQKNFAKKLNKNAKYFEYPAPEDLLEVSLDRQLGYLMFSEQAASQAPEN